jgi:hypothetical protein
MPLLFLGDREARRREKNAKDLGCYFKPTGKMQKI